MNRAGANADLESAYRDAEQQFRARNPNSERMHENAARVMPGGNTRSVLHYAPFPLTFAKGTGARLVDVDGHELLDFLGEYTAGIFGHDDPVIRGAIETAVSDGIVLGGPNLMEARLARAIVDRFPAIELVRFTNSGTEANLMALGAARASTGRTRIVGMQGGYHGGVLFLAAPSPINAPFEFTLLPYNEPDAARDLLRREGDSIACVIVEPMMGSSGCIPATREFLEVLREETAATGTLLILDEVMTSRLGPGGLHGEHGITPDLVTLGKYLGGGLSFGAFGGRADIMQGFDPRSPGAWPHAGTFNNNVASMSAGLAGITQLFTPERCRALNSLGDGMRDRLNAAIGARGLPMQVTGRGSMSSIHFTSDPVLRPVADPQLDLKRGLLHLDMIASGVYIARRAMLNMSLPMTGADVDAAVTAFEEFLDSRRSVLADAVAVA